ncbi:hypothetical protein JCM5350_003473 [Sporobolomyces pararoseus]
MDRLPPELLVMIADSIEQDPHRLRRQRSLAALARTNKTCYSICNSRIYRNPAMGEDRMVRKWVRFYLSKVNPWTVSKGCTNLVDLVLPESISFFTSSDFWTNTSVNSISPLLRPLDTTPAERSFVGLLFSPTLFQNLTSFSTSKSRRVDDDFLAHLFGPLGSNRTSIKTLLIPIEGWPVVSFLLESLSRSEWWWWPGIDGKEQVETLIDEINDWSLKEKLKQEYKLWEEDEPYDGLLEETLGEIAIDLGLVKYSVFKQLSDDPPFVQDGFDKNRYIRCHPFTSLFKLSLLVQNIEDIYLVFYSSLFPSLRILELAGCISLEVGEISHDFKLLRFSITEAEGTLIPPRLDLELSDLLRSSFTPSWIPLTTKEIKAEPKIDYFGPKLVELDLSGCEFGLTIE